MKDNRRKGNRKRDEKYDIGYFEKIFCNREPVVSDMRGRFSVLALFFFPRGEGEEGAWKEEAVSEKTAAKELNQEAALMGVRKEMEEGRLLFEVRSENLRHQPGEICLPGGHLEEGESPGTCALREASEELLIPEEKIRMLGPLGYDYTYYGELIHSYVGIADVEDLLTGGVYTAEVKEVFAVPFSFFMERGPQEYYDYGKYHIWGLTARVVRRLVRVCRGEESPAGTDWGSGW